MLRKLLKYDLKWCYKPLLVFYILAIFFSIITRIVESFEQTLMVLIIDKICSGIVIAMLISILINCFMRVWVRVIRNIYKDESYLTHTLPVSKNTIYLSKILTAMITLLTSFAVIIGCIAIVFLNEISWDGLKQYLEQSAIFFNSSVFSGIVGIILGYRSNHLKTVKSIISGFGIYMILSTFSVAVLYLAGFLNPDIMDAFQNIEISSNAMKSIMFAGIVVYAVYNVILYWIGNHLLSKGVNVD